ncbi:MAG: ATP-binding cassette domain-containing protein [Pirellulaceae bacterium]|nr:ATP-binding cassette domain-containing protein [Pirellulaceae bacterium]
MITIEDLSIGFRGPSLLDGVSCRIDARQKIGLLGRNGSGKTTLLRILSGQMEPDHGQVQFAVGTRVALLPQDVPILTGSVRSVVHDGAREASDDPEWKIELAVQRVLTQMDLDGELRYEQLSSGMKRRVLLARSLATEPNVLLLDEPTNHLDIEAIQWLEGFLGRWPGTLLFVTHDRMFLRRLAERILEIDRGHLFDWSCDYATFLQRKEAFLAAEEQQNALFDRKLAEEEVWIRQGIKARRTRNEGRVRALEKMRSQRQERRTDPGMVRMRIEEGQRSGNLVADVRQVSFSYGGTAIFQNFSTLIMRGDKVGIVGPNGAGKTTLVRVLVGDLPPSSGQVRLGTNLQLAYFDQLRSQLDDDKSAQENVADGYDTVRVGDGTRHVVGYLKDFLFTADRARTPVRFLSGGERNRLLLARLFAKPANLIVLDEPTNDLDSETLELLEERLAEFHGTVLVVSHDREFLNNVVTSTIVFERQGLSEYVGGYDDWLRQRKPDSDWAPRSSKGGQTTARPAASSAAPRTAQGTNLIEPADAAGKKRRLSYREQQELAGLPARIEQLEREIEHLHATMADPNFYAQPGERIAAEAARLKGLEEQLETAYLRLDELDAGA